MAARKKKPTFAELCLKDHQLMLKRAIRKIARENDWGCKMLAQESKASQALCSHLLRDDDHGITLDKLCLMAYELGIHVGITLVNPNE